VNAKEVVTLTFSSGLGLFIITYIAGKILSNNLQEFCYLRTFQKLAGSINTPTMILVNYAMRSQSLL
jgi:hypothetical protein